MRGRAVSESTLLRVLCVLAISAVMALATFGTFEWMARRRDAEVQKCQQTLRALWSVCELYRSSEGVPAPSLRALVESGYLAGALECPAEQHEDARLDNFGYSYIDWSQVDLGSEYSKEKKPCIFDKYGNHHFRGANVIYSDGSVRWDEGTDALRDFFRTHHEALVAHGLSWKQYATGAF